MVRPKEPYAPYMKQCVATLSPETRSPRHARKGPRRTSLSDSNDPVVDEPARLGLAALCDDDVPAVPALALDVLEAPDLAGLPAVADALDVALDGLALGGLGEPALAEEVVLDVGELDPVGLAADLAEDLVLVLARLAVELAQLGGALDAAGGRLFNVDVDDAGRVLVLLDVQGDGRHANGFARHPADALLGARALVPGSSHVASRGPTLGRADLGNVQTRGARQSRRTGTCS